MQMYFLSMLMRRVRQRVRNSVCVQLLWAAEWGERQGMRGQGDFTRAARDLLGREAWPCRLRCLQPISYTLSSGNFSIVLLFSQYFSSETCVYARTFGLRCNTWSCKQFLYSNLRHCDDHYPGEEFWEEEGFLHFLTCKPATVTGRPLLPAGLPGPTRFPKRSGRLSRERARDHPVLYTRSAEPWAVSLPLLRLWKLLYVSGGSWGMEEKERVFTFWKGCSFSFRKIARKPHCLQIFPLCSVCLPRKILHHTNLC